MAAELDVILQSMQALKPPGISKQKVEEATRICLDPRNKPVEYSLVDSMVNGFRRAAASHKLGILYVIDAVARPWFMSGPEHAGGIRRLTDALPSLMNEYVPVVPDAQKDKVIKLLEIWITTNVFPVGMLQDFRQRIQSPQVAAAPPPQQTFSAPPVQQQQQQQQQPQGMPNLSNMNPAALFAALAAHSAPQGQQQAPVIQQPPPSIPPANAAAVMAAMGIPTSLPASFANQMPAQQPQNLFPPQQAQPPAQSFTLPGQLPFSIPNIPQPPAQAPTQAPPANVNPLAALLGQAQGGTDATALLGQLQALSTLQQQLGPDGFRTLLTSLGVQMPGGIPQATSAPPAQPPFSPPQPQQTQYQPFSNIQAANAPNRVDSRNRQRSRSPDSKRRRVSPPNRRESPTYGTYEPNGGRDARQQAQDRARNGRGKGDYRQRSPQRDSTPRNDGAYPPPGAQPKPIGWDFKLPEGNVKVLSRTLFVGGVKANESTLKAFFSQFGTVQSCIVNNDKRHAFLKMISHQEALTTKQAVGVLPETEYRSMFERVNWAVGFGPTKYADYNAGESVIPISTFTEADRKWMVTAEFGGTGGQDITAGMIVEEPDIEIGAGPSSKAIHRRGGGGGGATAGGGGGRGGQHFGRRGGRDGEGGGRSGRKHRDHGEPPVAPEANNIGVPPPVPTFGGPITGFPNFR